MIKIVHYIIFSKLLILSYITDLYTIIGIKKLKNKKNYYTNITPLRHPIKPKIDPIF